MTWRGAAIVVCAAVAVAAGAVTVVADAVAADQAPPRLGATTDSSAPTAGGSSPYRSTRTITLYRRIESCASKPAPDRDGPDPSCIGAVRLPVGASEQDVLTALGQPQSRQPMRGGGEAWYYTTWAPDNLDGQDYDQGYAILSFDRHRLADARAYIFK